MYDAIIANSGISTTIHNHRTANRVSKLPSGSIIDAENAISSFSFSIYPNNQGYDLLTEFVTLIEVYNNSRLRNDFKGRVLKIYPELDSKGSLYKDVVCESCLGYLNDSVQPYAAERQFEGDEDRNGLEEFIDLLLDNHNSQVEEYKQIFRGNITLTTYESSEGVYKGLNYETTWECIQKKLIDSFGGQIILREVDGVNYLDYAEKLGSTRSTEIRVGKNIKSAKREVDPSEIITRLIPLGKKMSVTTTDDKGNETSTETDERLTISSVNDGVIYIQDDIAYAKYGAKYGTAEWDDVTDASNLLAKGQAYLQDHNYIIESIKIDALDLSIIGMDIDDFVLYDSYPAINGLIGLNDTLQIIKKTTNIIEVQNSSFEMGESLKSLMSGIVDVESNIASVASAVSKVSTSSANRASALTSFINQTTSLINQTSNQIALSVENLQESISDYETFKTIVTTQLQLDASGAALIFDTINQYIEQVNGVSISNYNEILKYIRFEDGDIILGNTESPFSLKIENDQMAFYYNSIALAQLEPNQLYIPEQIKIAFGGRLIIGNYALVPRSNGNLSLKYIGG